MPPKTPKKLLSNTLENLTDKNFEKFVHELLDRQQEPRVRRNRVEGKNFLEVADVMISTFTEKKALTVAVELLNEIGCSQDAEELAKGAKGLQSTETRSADEEHFVDKHRQQLIQRVTNVGPILDKLLQQKVVQTEAYAEIDSKPTNQAKMRAIYMGPLAAGRACKDIFYQILQTEEPFLIKELENN